MAVGITGDIGGTPNGNNPDVTFLGLSCQPACERTFDVELLWMGGNPVIPAPMDVQVLAWAIAADAADPLTLISGDRLDVTTELPRLTAGTEVARHLEGGERILEILTATLDLGTVPDRGRFEGFARVTLTGVAPGEAGDGSRVEFGVGETSIHADAGAPMVSTSEFVPVSCMSGRSCDVAIRVHVHPERTTASRDVAFRLDAEFLSADGDAMPEGATVKLDLAPRVAN